MPGWHARTLELQEAGKIRIVGLIQEQHPDRCRLFLQWKRLGWPVLVDSLNQLGLSAVPINMLIDERGVVHSKRAKEDDLERFLKLEIEKPEKTPAPPTPPTIESLGERVKREPESARAWRDLGDALFLSGKSANLSASMEAYRESLELEDSGITWFRLGVATRRRHETSHREADDFQAAVTAWEKALERDPDQYIWRRRIQQYGPRLQKPYAFYDWVTQAREEIRARGEEPVPLAVEPRGAELAHPDRSFETEDASAKSPDPGGKIRRDLKGLIRPEITVAPGKLEPGGTVRVHVTLRPEFARKAHWNNEAGDSVLWLDAPAPLEVSRRLHRLAGSREVTSEEPRSIEFEVRLPEKAAASLEAKRLTLRAYALYYVCEDVEGVCQYLRLDLPITLEIEQGSR